MIDDFRYRRVITWKSAEAASAGRARYPSSSINKRLGPA
jgi:hypothetical protein